MCDFDIFDVGSVRDMIRWMGASKSAGRTNTRDDRATHTIENIGHYEVMAVGVVKVGCALTGELDVLSLVMANRNMCRSTPS